VASRRIEAELVVETCSAEGIDCRNAEQGSQLQDGHTGKMAEVCLNALQQGDEIIGTALFVLEDVFYLPANGVGIVGRRVLRA
jgi:hypothetical protein